MVGLLFLILFLSVIAGTYYYTRHILSIKKRIAWLVSVPLLTFYGLFFKECTTKLFTPLYCLVNSNTKIKEHISPEDWKKKSSKIIDVRLQNLGEFDFLTSNLDKSKYIEDINIDGINYNLLFFNKNMTNLAIYISNNHKLFGKDIYLYYDIDINKPIISLEEYVSEYRGMSGSNNVSSCNDNVLSDLRNYFIENYLNRQ